MSVPQQRSPMLETKNNLSSFYVVCFADLKAILLANSLLLLVT